MALNAATPPDATGRTAAPSLRFFYTGGDIDKQLDLIVSEIDRGTRSATVQAEASRALGRKRNGKATVPEHDGRHEAAAIRRHVAGNIRYKRDPIGLDVFESAERTLDLGNADCDGQTILTAALAQAAGYPVAVRVISTRPDGRFNHVYPLIEAEPGVWLAADTTVDYPLGWEPTDERITASKTVAVTDGKAARFTGMARASVGDERGSGWVPLLLPMAAALVFLLRRLGS
jgi:transglutaminase-like putative cysteine protease